MGLREPQLKLLNELRDLHPGLLSTRKLIAVHSWPGTGKSALPVIAAHVLIQRNLVDKVVIAVPRLTLKEQGAKAFLSPTFRELLGHRMEIREAGNEPNPARDTAGYVTTYDAIRADQAGVHRDYFRSKRCLLALDECHHVAEGSPTHKSLQPLFDLSAFCLLLTGSIDRNLEERIALLRYSGPPGGRLFPDVDISYGLAKAIAARAVIPAEFHQLDGQVSYIDRTGQQVWLGTLMNDDEESRDGIYAALKTEYATELLSRCVSHWKSYRVNHPRSLLLVVCASKKQAGLIHDHMRQQLGIDSAIATSDDSAAAQAAIKRFRDRGEPAVLITVQMAYEGLDVPPITHVACLTHIRSFPWLMQMFGRATRFDPEAGPWSSQKAFLFVPDDVQMQQAIEYVRNEQAIGITEQGDEAGGDGTGTGDSGTGGSSPGVTTVVPLSGSATRERTSGMYSSDDLGYEDTAKIKLLIDRHHLGASVLDVADMLKELRVDLSAVPSPQQNPPTGPTSVTAGQRETALRANIQSLLSRLDAHTGNPFGTWNKRCLREAQKFVPRDRLTEAELVTVWRWCCDYARRAGLNEPGDL